MTTTRTWTVRSSSATASLLTTALVGPLIGTLLAAPTSAAAPARTASTLSPQLIRAAPHTVRHLDATRDVALFDPESRSDTPSPLPANRSTDIVSTVVQHRARRLAVRVELRNTARSGYRFVVAGLRTPADEHFDILLDYSRRPASGRVEVTGSRGRPVSCPGRSWSLDPATAHVRVSVPRSCLGDPRWVRVGVGTTAVSRDFDSIRGDDSRRDGLARNRLVLGPRQPHA